MSTFSFFADTYDTERLKILSVWSQIPDDQMDSGRSRAPGRRSSTWCTSA